MKIRLTFLSLVLVLIVTMSSKLMNPVPPPIGPYLNGHFTETPPGEVGSWQLEDAYPSISIPSPLRIIPFPNSDDYLVLSKLGLVYRINLEAQSTQLVLDITDRSFKLGEAGTTSIVLHPEIQTSGQS